MPSNVIAYLFAGRVTPPTSSGALAQRRFEAGDWVMLVVYSAALAFGVLHHVPWVDEAQAWLIARDEPVRVLLLRRLHYEGAPPLWHLLLKAGIHAGMLYHGMNWMGALFALLGIVVFLRWSPFPRAFRWLMPFTFFLLFQYGVVARPYVLCPLLVFLLCMAFASQRPRPVLFATVAGFLANLNAHTAILACMFVLLYTHEHIRKGSFRMPQLRHRFYAAASLFCVFCLVSVASAFPAPDATVVPAATGTVKASNPLLEQLIPMERLPPGAPPLDRDLDQLYAGVSPPSANTAPKRFPTVRRFWHKVKSTAELTADLVTFPIAESNFLALAVLAALAVWMWERRCLRFLLPWAVTAPVAAWIWVYDHHTGILLLALLAASWLTLEQSARERHPSGRSALSLAGLALFAVLLQVGWSVHALLSQVHVPYDGGQEAAAYLAGHAHGKRMAASTYEAVSIQPYAGHNLFANWEHSFWVWSNVNPINLRLTEASLEHPDIVVVGDLAFEQDTLVNQWHERYRPGQHPEIAVVNFWKAHGYHETHSFCGSRVMRSGDDNTVCERIFEPIMGSNAAAMHLPDLATTSTPVRR